jgi:pimeloyl-ACP methyl ester carboxylesterase
MGYSLGSSVALQTAIRHPDVVDRLVLVSAPMRQDGYYPEGVAAFNQMEANAAMLGGSRQGIAVRAGLSRCRLDEPLPQAR